MKFIAYISIISIFLISCSKDEFNTEPTIKFISVSPNTYTSGTTISEPGPILKFQLTDLEGDFGTIDDSSISFAYIKNTTIFPYNSDSIKFPVTQSIKRRNLDAEVELDLKKFRGILDGSDPITDHHPQYIDTVYFEVFVRDMAKNKSNVIKSSAVYIITRER